MEICTSELFPENSRPCRKKKRASALGAVRGCVGLKDPILEERRTAPARSPRRRANMSGERVIHVGIYIYIYMYLCVGLQNTGSGLLEPQAQVVDPVPPLRLHPESSLAPPTSCSSCQG